MSEGSRSGVNWMRLNVAPIERASALASVVLPRARVIFQQHVAAAGEGGEQAADGQRLPLHEVARFAAMRPATSRAGPALT